MRDEVEGALAPKGIDYEKLKTALVPDRKRKEIALVFDTQRVDDSWYGLPVFKRFMPIFDRQSNHSVLAGDYLGNNEHQETLFGALRDAASFVRDTTYKHSTQFYVIYINNLTETMFHRFVDGLLDYEAFVGFADMTYGSRFKWLLSTMLVNAFIKHRNIVIQGHPDDVPNSEDENTSLYPFEEFGYECRSVQSILEGTMLSYKIERPVFSGFESDTEFALNAISDTPLPLDTLDVEVAEAKLNYLRRDHLDALLRAGLLNADADMVARIIKERVSESYLYNLRYDEENDAALFNVIVELPKGEGVEPVRLLAALRYQASDKALHLVTFY